MATCGGVVSRLTSTLAVSVNPSLFTATAVMVLMPSCTGTVARKVLPVTGVAIPLTVTCAAGSTTVPVTLIGLWLNRAELTGEVILIWGGRTKATVASAEPIFPAASTPSTRIVLVPTTRAWEQVKDEPVTVAGTSPHITFASPEPESLTVPLRVTLGTPTVVPATGEVMVMDGGVLSRLIEDVTVALLSAPSVTRPFTSWFFPSVLIVAGLGQDATPDNASW